MYCLNQMLAPAAFSEQNNYLANQNHPQSLYLKQTHDTFSVKWPNISGMIPADIVEVHHHNNTANLSSLILGML